MKKYLLMCIPVLLFIACATLKKETTKAKIATTAQVEQKSKVLMTSNVLKLWVDSSHLEEEVVLWPIGIIKYSMANGFEGEVAKISLRKKDQGKKLLLETKTANVVLNQELVSKYKETEVKNSVNLKKKSSHGWLIGFLFVVILGSGAFIYLKR